MTKLCLYYYLVVHTSSVTSAAHTFERDPAAHAAVAAAARPVIRSRPLHSHHLPLRLVVRTHLCTTALENLYVPTRAKAHRWNCSLET